MQSLLSPRTRGQVPCPIIIIVSSLRANGATGFVWQQTAAFQQRAYSGKCPVVIGVEAYFDLFTLVVVDGFFEGFDDDW